MLFFNLLHEMLFLENSGEDGGNSNPNPDEPQKEQTTIKFGNIEVNPSDPESIKKAQEAYLNVEKLAQSKSQELANLKKNQESNTPNQKENSKKENQELDKTEYLYRKEVDREYSDFINSQKQQLKSKYGDNYEVAKDDFEKALNESSKKFTTEQKIKLIKEGNFETLFQRKFGEKQLTAKEQKEQKQQKQQENLKEKQNQEELPNEPSGQGKAPVPGADDVEVKPDHSYSKAREKSQRARISERGGIS